MIDFGATGIDSWFELLFMLGGSLVTVLLVVLMTFVNRWVKAKTDISIFQNEEQMRGHLFDAVFNGFQTVVQKNDFEKVKQDKEGTTEAIKEYLKQTSPEVLKKLKIAPNSEALSKAIQARLESIIQDQDQRNKDKML